ncbi:MAG: CDP-glycerol glycerophosphotransferase family protein [Anaerolineae bacterium]|nr:CDP-glycerol glycerophosphotransferase family protein [Anaerolineae bacterium]
MKRIIIANNHFQANEVNKWANYLHANIYNLDSSRGEGDSTIESFLTTDDIWSIWEQAYKFTQEWYTVLNKDYTLYQDISIGKILEIELWYYWRDLFEQIEALKRVLDLTKPDEIYLATSKNKQIAQLLQGFWQTEAHIKCLQPSFASRVKNRRKMDMETVRQHLKEKHIDRYVRLFALIFSKFRYGSRRTPYDKNNPVIDVLALLEQPAAYLADSVFPVLEFFPSAGILLLDPRHQQRAVRSNREVIYQTDFLWQHIYCFRQTQKLFLDRYRAYQAYLPQALQYKGKYLGAMAKDKVQHLFKWVFPLVAIEIAGAQQLFIERAINSLLLVTDAHHGGRLYTLVANQLGVPSLVIQHGATMGEWGYVPLYATKFAAWGEMSAKWMVDQGVAHDRLVITGQPRLDALVNTPLTLTREVLCTRLNLKMNEFWLLWAMDPIPKSANDRVLQILLEALEHLSWCHLIIRPHPGIQQLTWISDKVHERERVVVSSVQEPLYNMLNIVDAVIIQGSTVGIEAMAFDKPVLVLQERDSAIDPLYAQSSAVAKVTNATELCQVLADIYHYQQFEGTDPYAFGRQELVHHYLFEVDGQSAKRVAEAMIALRNER